MKKTKIFFSTKKKKFHTPRPFQEEELYMNPNIYKMKKFQSHKRKSKFQKSFITNIYSFIKSHYLLCILVLISPIILKFLYHIIKTKILSNNKAKISINEKFINILPRTSPYLDKNITNIDEVFNSRELYISDAKITQEYIRYIRPLNISDNDTNDNRYSESDIDIIINKTIFDKRSDQYNYVDFCKLNLEEKLINEEKIEYNNKPLISVVIPTFNKKYFLLKSIRSIQNQKFKNIEIIIVDDCSTDNSTYIFNYLIESDPRIRVFHHLKNLGCWRSRLDGILYSKGKYVILFDTGDLYEDNYVLTDAFNVIEKYNLDSCKFIFRILKSYNNLEKSFIYFSVPNNTKIAYGTKDIEDLNKKIFNIWGNIWNRIVRADIYTKAFYLLNDLLLNIYKNVYDDAWFNNLVNKVSFNFTVLDRIGYVYLQDGNGEGSPKTNTDEEKSKFTNENIGFIYYDYNFISKNESKRPIIDKLKLYEKGNTRYKLSYLKSNYEILNNLLESLIKEPNLSDDDKIYVEKLLKDNKDRENELNKTQN